MGIIFERDETHPYGTTSCRNLSDDEIVLEGLKILVKKHQAIIDQYIEEAIKITGDTTEFTHDWFWDFPSEDFTAKDLLEKCK